MHRSFPSLFPNGSCVLGMRSSGGALDFLAPVPGKPVSASDSVPHVSHNSHTPIIVPLSNSASEWVRFELTACLSPWVLGPFALLCSQPGMLILSAAFWPFL